MLVRILAIAFVLLCCSFSYAEEAVEIPLSDIWALDMPGTKDVRELEPEIHEKRGKGLPPEEWRALQAKSLLQQIYPQLKLKHGRSPKRGFAVSGTGLDALKAARDVMTEEREISDSLSVESDVTVVFSSLQSGSYVHIYDIERQGNVIEIRYRLISHEEGFISENFALIPLGKLPTGMYQVKFVLGQAENNPSAGLRQRTTEAAEKIINRSFKFSTK